MKLSAWIPKRNGFDDLAYRFKRWVWRKWRIVL